MGCIPHIVPQPTAEMDLATKEASPIAAAAYSTFSYVLLCSSHSSPIDKKVCCISKCHLTRTTNHALPHTDTSTLTQRMLVRQYV